MADFNPFRLRICYLQFLLKLHNHLFHYSFQNLFLYLMLTQMSDVDFVAVDRNQEVLVQILQYFQSHLEFLVNFWFIHYWLAIIIIVGSFMDFVWLHCSVCFITTTKDTNLNHSRSPCSLRLSGVVNESLVVLDRLTTILMYLLLSSFFQDGQKGVRHLLLHNPQSHLTTEDRQNYLPQFFVGQDFVVYSIMDFEHKLTMICIPLSSLDQNLWLKFDFDLK